MPTANTSVGISGILKLPRRRIYAIKSVKGLLGIKNEQLRDDMVVWHKNN